MPLTEPLRPDLNRVKYWLFLIFLKKERSPPVFLPPSLPPAIRPPASFPPGKDNFLAAPPASGPSLCLPPTPLPSKEGFPAREPLPLPEVRPSPVPSPFKEVPLAMAPPPLLPIRPLPSEAFPFAEDLPARPPGPFPPGREFTPWFVFFPPWRTFASWPTFFLLDSPAPCFAFNPLVEANLVLASRFRALLFVASDSFPLWGDGALLTARERPFLRSAASAFRADKAPLFLFSLDRAFLRILDDIECRNLDRKLDLLPPLAVFMADLSRTLSMANRELKGLAPFLDLTAFSRQKKREKGLPRYFGILHLAAAGSDQTFFPRLSSAVRPFFRLPAETRSSPARACLLLWQV